ncbi:MAG TPA: LysE family transporter [Solirubrobacteraceae bacterium]|nr:LysE family transporter [Solirubrobacteraceae bacterium]
MDVPEALWAGLIVGIAIATQFGAISALVLETAVRAGPRAGAAAGLGVASVDVAYATGAVLAGGAARAGLAAHQAEVKTVAAVILALVGVHGLWALKRDPSRDQRAPAPSQGDATRPFGARSAQYLRFVGLTAINPLTIVYFGSVTASLSLNGVAEGVAFVTGAGTASALWHLALSLAAGHAGRRFTPTIQRAVSVAGRLAVVLIAIRLAIAI